VKKILIFSLAYYPQVGGAEVAIKEITDRLPDIEWHMVTLRFDREHAREEKVGNIIVHRVGSGGLGYLSKILFVPQAAIAAKKLHKTYSFDAAWAMMSYMLLPLCFATLNIPHALTLQEGDTAHHMFSRLRIVPFMPFINQGFRRAAVVQAISSYLGGWTRARGFAGPLEVIPNGVDVKKFGGEKILHEGVVLVTSSRLVKKNAVDIIIRALALLPQVRLVIAGVGPEEKNLKTLAHELNVTGRIKWLGFVDHSQLPAVLHASDIFVRPSRSEGMGNSFVEAMAAGLPVIATQEGGLKDFITPRVAWPVLKDSPEAIAHAVKDILGNPARTAQVIQRARQLAFETYDWNLVARQMREKVFARVLG
jgi:glycosyltransferase involved in cell wall biosynthesis